MEGEPGSPVIAIDTAKEHTLKLNAELVFRFIESQEDRCEHLEEVLLKIELPDNIKYRVKCSKFDESLTSLFDELDEQGKQIAPTFAFVDPFGYSQTPFHVIERIMKNKRCEVLITFMSGFLNRFKSDPPKEKAFDLLFDTTEWREIISDLDPDEKSEKKIVEFYQNRLEVVAKYVRTFEMRNKFNQPIYHLIFCTNSIDGLKKMNDSMWKADEKSGFTFSDRTDPHQTVLFKHEPDFKQLKKLIVDKFKGKEVLIEKIEDFVAIKGFKISHLRKPILKEMETVNPPEIEVLKERKRRKGTYPKGTVIRFL